jgi:periplasmic copper chaperone A
LLLVIPATICRYRLASDACIISRFYAQHSFMKKLFFLTLLFLCNSVVAAESTDLLIDNPFVRPALQQQRNSALFMQISNQGGDAELVGASTEAAKIVELHTHVNDNGVMRMRKVDKIDIPAGQSVMLQPGGFHIMFIGLNHDLNIGDSVNVTLEFSDGSKKSVTVPVQRGMTMPAPKDRKSMQQN